MKTKNPQTSLSVVLFLIFLILKLTDTIDWSWWWVTSPLWVPVALLVVIGLPILFIVVVIREIKK